MASFPFKLLKPWETILPHGSLDLYRQGPSVGRRYQPRHHQNRHFKATSANIPLSIFFCLLATKLAGSQGQ